MLSYKPRVTTTNDGFWFDEVPIDFSRIKNPEPLTLTHEGGETMKNDSINRWVFFIPADAVKTISGDALTENGCFLCGRTIKRPRYSVHLLTDGMLVSSDEPFDNSQGFFAIGGECRKRLPNNFVFKNDAD